MEEVIIALLEDIDRDQFIKENQEAFRYGAMEEFGLRDDHFEEEGEIISRKTIEEAIDQGTAYRIIQDGKKWGALWFEPRGQRAVWIFYLFRLWSTVKGSAVLHGIG